MITRILAKQSNKIQVYLQSFLFLNSASDPVIIFYLYYINSEISRIRVDTTVNDNFVEISHDKIKNTNVNIS